LKTTTISFTDALVPDRYHCLHAAGVHTVALPWIEDYYQQYFLSEGEPFVRPLSKSVETSFFC
jgi:hypothetical protein